MSGANPALTYQAAKPVCDDESRWVGRPRRHRRAATDDEINERYSSGAANTVIEPLATSTISI